VLVTNRAFRGTHSGTQSDLATAPHTLLPVPQLLQVRHTAQLRTVGGTVAGRIANLKPWKPGQSGNPGGRPKRDLAAEIARSIFERDPEAIEDPEYLYAYC
jgi:hypothetical protein